MKKRKGFTLIETMIVIAIIAILAAILGFNMTDAKNKAECEREASAIRNALMEAGSYASKIDQDLAFAVDGGTLQALTNEGDTIPCFRKTNKIPYVYNAANVDTLCLYAPQMVPTAGNTVPLMLANSGDGLYRLNVTLGNTVSGVTDNFIIAPKGATLFANDGTRRPVIVISKGNYSFLIELVATGNINIYSAKVKNGVFQTGVTQFSAAK